MGRHPGVICRETLAGALVNKPTLDLVKREGVSEREEPHPYTGVCF